MGKRSSFERVPRDFYPTPHVAVLPLLPHLKPRTRFAEPCAGDGALIDALEEHGHVCVWAADVEPRRADIHENDASSCGIGLAQMFITNPPWKREDLHDILVNLSNAGPTWLLFDADWIHTRQSAPHIPRLRKIVSVGRLKWIPDLKMTGKDNCAWHLFDKPSSEPARFYGR